MTLARALASAGAGVDGEEGSQYFTGVLSDPHNAALRDDARGSSRD